MQATGHHRATPGRPFPNARKSSILEEEDRFMEAHGGSGARSVYQAVCLVEVILGGIVRFLRDILTLRLVRDLSAGVSRRLQKSDPQKTALHDTGRSLRLGSE